MSGTLVVGQWRQVFWCTVRDMLSVRGLTGQVHVITRVASGIGFTAAKESAVKNIAVEKKKKKVLCGTHDSAMSVAVMAVFVRFGTHLLQSGSSQGLACA